MSHDAAAAAFPSPRENRAAMLLGGHRRRAAGGDPLLIWWLDRATVYALGFAVIAGIYVGFAVADGWQHRSHFVATTRWWPPFCNAIARARPSEILVEDVRAQLRSVVG